MSDLSQYIVEIIEDSIQAGAKHIMLNLIEDLKKDLLVIEIGHDLQSIRNTEIASATRSFVSSNAEKKVSIGLSLLAEEAKMSDGHLSISSDILGNTKVRAVFKYSHAQRKPIGCLGSRLLTIVSRHPNIEFVCHHSKNGARVSLDTKRLRDSSKIDRLNDLKRMF